MNPEARYELDKGEWRSDPPHISYAADRSGLVRLLSTELTAAPWTSGEGDTGPTIEVDAETLCPPASAEEVDRLVKMATPAPYGRGEETVLDAQVRDARQIEAGSGAAVRKLLGGDERRTPRSSRPANGTRRRKARDGTAQVAHLRTKGALRLARGHREELCDGRERKIAQCVGVRLPNTVRQIEIEEGSTDPGS